MGFMEEQCGINKVGRVFFHEFLRQFFYYLLAELDCEVKQVILPHTVPLQDLL